MPSQPTDADERLHEPASSPTWTEAYGFEFAAHDGSLGGFVVMTAHPLLGRSWCWSAVAGRSRSVCMVDEPEAPLPRRAGMELRAPALWVDVEIELPFVHATVGMEAFGLTFDDPDEALRSGRGDRTPFGLDLEWESDPVDVAVVDGEGVEGYEVACHVTGDVLLGLDVHPIDTRGRRWHRWGTRPWWDVPATDRADEWAHVVAPLPFPSVDVAAVRAALHSHGWSITRHFDSGTAGMAR